LFWPGGSFPHVPTVPDSAQLLQVPAQAVVQQYPSAQLLLVHWSLPPHACPVVFLGTHVRLGAAEQ
jgi:hypothetical protein